MEILKETRHFARKNYRCMGCPYVIDGDVDSYTPDELKAIEAARSDNFEIKAGMQYVRTVFKDEKDLFIFKARLDIHNICLKYDLYEE